MQGQLIQGLARQQPGPTPTNAREWPPHGKKKGERGAGTQKSAGLEAQAWKAEAMQGTSASGPSGEAFCKIASSCLTYSEGEGCVTSESKAILGPFCSLRCSAAAQAAAAWQTAKTA